MKQGEVTGHRQSDRGEISGLKYGTDAGTAAGTASVHKALSHPVRLRIAELLADKGAFGVADEECCAVSEVCVCRMKDLFDLSPPALSHHLAVLRRAGVVETRRDGTRIYYRLRPERLRWLADRLLTLAAESERGVCGEE